MAKIGLVPGAYKPYHAGHDAVIRMASRDNDRVHVFASTSDRDNVSGAAMKEIWWDEIEPSLPDNVEVTFGGSPVGNVFKLLGNANEAGSKDTFTVYSDPDDLKANYKTLPKYAGNLVAAGRVILRAVPRSETVDVSGTQMRQWLASGDKESFTKHLPKGIDGNAVWATLQAAQPGSQAAKRPSKQPTAEGLLRSYVRLLLSR